MADAAKPGHSPGLCWLLNTGIVIDCASTVVTLAAGVGVIFGIGTLTEMGLIDKPTLTMTLSFACPLVMMTQYVSPIPVVLDAIRKMSAQNLPVQVFQSQAACNILGLAYAIQIANSSVFITNLFGLGCQILYLAGNHHIQSPNAGWLMFSIELSVLMDAGLYVFAMISPINILGHLILVLNITACLMPLTKLGIILRSRNAASLPTAMTFISMANNASWSLYALMIGDAVVLLPSVVGFLLSTFQVLIILWCQGRLPFDLAFLLLLSRDRRDVLPSAAVMKVPSFPED